MIGMSEISKKIDLPVPDGGGGRRRTKGLNGRENKSLRKRDSTEATQQPR